jgi:cytidine deaminase
MRTFSQHYNAERVAVLKFFQIKIQAIMEVYGKDSDYLPKGKILDALSELQDDLKDIDTKEECTEQEIQKV